MLAVWISHFLLQLPHILHLSHNELIVNICLTEGLYTVAVNWWTIHLNSVPIHSSFFFKMNRFSSNWMTTTNDKSWCEVRNALKAVQIQNLTLSDQYLTIKFQRKSYNFWFFRLQFKFWNGPFQMDIQIFEYSAFWNFLEYSRIVLEVSLKDTLLFKCSDFLILWSFWSSPHQMHIQMIE